MLTTPTQTTHTHHHHHHHSTRYTHTLLEVHWLLAGTPSCVITLLRPGKMWQISKRQKVVLVVVGTD